MASTLLTLLSLQSFNVLRVSLVVLPSSLTLLVGRGRLWFGPQSTPLHFCSRNSTITFLPVLCRLPIFTSFVPSPVLPYHFLYSGPSIVWYRVSVRRRTKNVGRLILTKNVKIHILRFLFSDNRRDTRVNELNRKKTCVLDFTNNKPGDIFFKRLGITS